MSTTSHHRRLPLQELALAPASRTAYNRQLDKFLLHTRLQHHHLFDTPPHQLDRLLAEYIQFSYDQHAPFGYAAHALHAVVHYNPLLKAHLPVARQCLKGWERVKKSASHPPLTWELTVVIACTLARSGFHAPAISMLLAFDCYLRVGELTRIRRCDVVMPNDSRVGRVHAAVGTGMAICLPHTKTGPNQSVTVQNQVVADILCLWLKSLDLDASSEELVFRFSPTLLRQLMRNACIELGIGDTPYVPHSLRHGGATHDFARTQSIEHVQFRGRWKSMESSRRYIQTTRALLAAHQVPEHLDQLGRQLGDSLVTVMRHALVSVPSAAPPRRVTWRL